MARLTDSGVEIQKFEAILQELQSIARTKFADLVDPNDELDVSSNSVLGRILAIIAEPESYNEELLLMLWQSLDPDQATGIFLDKVLGLMGVYRKPETKGFAGLILHTTTGAIIPEKSLVASKVTGDIFETTSEVIASPLSANGVVVKFEDMTEGTDYAIGYSTVFNTNKYPPVRTSAAAGDTRNMLATRFSEVVKSSSTLLEAYVDNNDNVVVRFKDRNTVGSFTTTATASFVECFSSISSISVTANAGRQAAGTLDVIQTPVLGWLGVSNPFDSIPSNGAEVDAEFRSRGRLSKAIKSASNRTALYTDLYSLNGVTFVNIKENVYDNPTGGRSAKGIAVVVLGGDDDEIAQKILDNNTLGCLTDGVITKVITDAAGSTDVRFSRPEFEGIQIKISLTAEPNFPQNGKVLIQEALVRYFDSLEVGDDVVWSKLFNPINEVSGQSVNSLQIGLKGGVLGTSNIPMSYNKLATLSFEDIDI